MLESCTNSMDVRTLDFSTWFLSFPSTMCTAWREMWNQVVSERENLTFILVVVTIRHFVSTRLQLYLKGFLLIGISLKVKLECYCHVNSAILCMTSKWLHEHLATYNCFFFWVQFLMLGSIFLIRLFFFLLLAKGKWKSHMFVYPYHLQINY